MRMSDEVPSPRLKLAICFAVGVIIIVWFGSMTEAVIATAIAVAVAVVTTTRRRS